MKQTVILKNKLFLYLTEFFAGMSVMAVELGASLDWDSVLETGSMVTVLPAA